MKTSWNSTWLTQINIRFTGCTSSHHYIVYWSVLLHSVILKDRGCAKMHSYFSFSYPSKNLINEIDTHFMSVNAWL